MGRILELWVLWVTQTCLGVFLAKTFLKIVYRYLTFKKRGDVLHILKKEKNSPLFARSVQREEIIEAFWLLDYY